MPTIVITMNMDTITADTKPINIIDKRCRHCMLKTYNHLLNKYKIEKNQRLYFFMFYQEILLKHKNLSSQEIHQIFNEKISDMIGIDDLFSEEKTENNFIALKLYVEWKNKVLESPDPFDLSLRLAIAGNIMDYGANNNFDVKKTIHQVISADFAIDDSLLLKQKIQQAHKILYLGDNAGEIVFDKLFIETIMHNNVVYVVKGAPILNDVTMKDADEVGMNLVSDVISNGYGAPSTIIRKCSVEFKKIFQEADLIISKGQGNLEGLINQHDPRVFFLLMVKCDVIAELINVKAGDFVVYNQK